ncbi:lytic transglycosylase domain-containing protein, partial [Kingella kingae]|nr:lytic transglycosylase domain-containing protein [Kingella kingae]
MNAFRIGLHGISGVAVAILAACSTQQTSKQPAPLLPTQTPVAPMGVQTYQRTKETPDKIIADFARLESTLAAVNNGNDTAASQFLATQSQSDMGEKVRNAWLKSLGPVSYTHL